MTCYDTCCRPEQDEIDGRVLSRRPVRRTRKAHQCTDCRREIPAGSPAVSTAMLSDGEFWAGYQHDLYGHCTYPDDE